MSNTGSVKYLTIRQVNQWDSDEIQKCYPEETEGHIRVGENGYIFPSRYRSGVNKVYNFTVRPTDIYVASFPRSGTTWMQELVWLITNDFDFETSKRVPLTQRYPVLEFFMYVKNSTKKKLAAAFINDKVKSRMLDAITTFPGPYLNLMTTPRYIKTHMPLSLLPPNLLKTSKMVYVARDPRDVAVSFYHICRVMSKLNPIVEDFKKCWNLFIKDLVLWSPIFKHVKEAWNQRHHPNMLFLFYEDLAQDLPAAIRRVSMFFGKQCSDQQIRALCQHLNIDNFKRNHALHLTDFEELGLLTEPEHFIRKGKVGGWRDYFDKEMELQAEVWIAENLKNTDLRFPSFKTN